MVSDINQEQLPSSREILPPEESLEEGCKYVDVEYTENACRDVEYNFTISRDQFLNNRYGINYLCTDAIRLKNEDNGPGNWKIGYVFEIGSKTYEAVPIINYIEPGKEAVFRFEKSCEQDTEFDGVYFIIEQPTKLLCGPVTKIKKDVKCGLQEE